MNNRSDLDRICTVLSKSLRWSLLMYMTTEQSPYHTLQDNGPSTGGWSRCTQTAHDRAWTPAACLITASGGVNRLRQSLAKIYCLLAY